MWQLNEGALLNILKDFYTLTSIQIVLIDSGFREVLRYPGERIDFCAMIRRQPELDRRCAACDKDGCARCSESRQPTIYRCYAGLMEAVVPILDQDGILGYIMFGQIIRREDHTDTIAALKETFLEAEHPGISEAIEAIPTKSAEEIRAAATVLQALTAFALSNRWVVPKKTEFIRRLDRYIEDNLSSGITVGDLCRSFHISRTRLYAVSMEYLGMGLAEYVRSKRIEHAKRMLRSSDAPIAQIAFSTGFSDYNYFSRVFRSATGMSARAYRQENGEG